MHFRFLITLCCLFQFVNALGQTSWLRQSESGTNTRQPELFVNIINWGDVSARRWSQPECQVLDTSLMEIVYALKYRRDAARDVYENQLVVLQIGHTHQRYYSMITQFRDKVSQYLDRRAKAEPAFPGMGFSYPDTDQDRWIKEHAGRDYINSEIWCDHTTKILTERMHSYVKTNECLEYSELLPHFEWTLLEQRDTICGYPCAVAQTSFRGRQWTAWYTLDIPISLGPWKFNGLPGLILRACDSQNDFCWESLSLSQKKNPLIYYKVHTIRMDRSKWQRNRQRMHESPLDILTAGGTIRYFMQGEPIVEEDKWQIPYNPIERE